MSNKLRQYRNGIVSPRTLSFVVAATVAATGAGCSNEVTPIAPVSSEAFIDEASHDAAPYLSHQITTSVKFEPPEGNSSFNVRRSPGIADNKCGEATSFVLDNTVTVVTSGPTNFSGDWIAVATDRVNFVSGNCSGENAVWVNGSNVEQVTANTSNGSSTYTGNDNGRFMEGINVTNEVNLPNGDWRYLSAIAAAIAALQ